MRDDAGRSGSVALAVEAVPGALPGALSIRAHQSFTDDAIVLLTGGPSGIAQLNPSSETWSEAETDRRRPSIR